MNTRNTPRVFDVINDLGYTNLLVGGCSFTFNTSDTASSSWPYYVRDKCGFEQVYDCSVQAASNYQIMTSVVYALETTRLDPRETLVIVMWTGYSRDSVIVGDSADNNTEFVYHYTDQVHCVMNPGVNKKTAHSRAVENYIYVVALWEYLKSQGYRAVFLNFVEPGLPVRDATFDITKFLPGAQADRFESMFSPVENFYKYCVRHDLLQSDDFHPSMQGHLQWAHDVLVPALTVNPNRV
jgi:hypothetical protein